MNSVPTPSEREPEPRPAAPYRDSWVEYGIDFGDEIDGPYDTRADAVYHLDECRKWYIDNHADLSLLEPGTILRRTATMTVGTWEPDRYKLTASGDA